jgi:hypothetical protein
MNIISYCKADLEKILGFPVKIMFRKQGENSCLLTMSDLDYIKLEEKPITFEVKMADSPKPSRENGWFDGWISTWTLQQLPGCCGVLLSTGSNVGNKFRGKGVALRLNMFRQHIAHSQGYAMLMCTDVASNEPQNKVLQKNGWKRLFQFLNWRTQNKINISICEIPINPKHFGSSK